MRPGRLAKKNSKPFSTSSSRPATRATRSTLRRESGISQTRVGSRVSGNVPRASLLVMIFGKFPGSFPKTLNLPGEHSLKLNSNSDSKELDTSAILGEPVSQ